MRNPTEWISKLAVPVKKIIHIPYDGEAYAILNSSHRRFRYQGYHILFENERTISLLASPFNYSSNRRYEALLSGMNDIQKIPDGVDDWFELATTIELATWYKDHKPMHELSGNSTLGWLPEEHVMFIVDMILTIDHDSPSGICLENHPVDTWIDNAFPQRENNIEDNYGAKAGVNTGTV